MRDYCDYKEFLEDEDAKLSGNLDAYLKEGEQKQIPRKQAPEGKEVPKSTVDLALPFSAHVGK